MLMQTPHAVMESAIWIWRCLGGCCWATAVGVNGEMSPGLQREAFSLRLTAASGDGSHSTPLLLSLSYLSFSRIDILFISISLDSSISSLFLPSFFSNQPNLFSALSNVTNTTDTHTYTQNVPFSAIFSRLGTCVEILDQKRHSWVL